MIRNLTVSPLWKNVGRLVFEYYLINKFTSYLLLLLSVMEVHEVEEESKVVEKSSGSILRIRGEGDRVHGSESRLHTHGKEKLFDSGGPKDP